MRLPARSFSARGSGDEATDGPVPFSAASSIRVVRSPSAGLSMHPARAGVEGGKDQTEKVLLFSSLPAGPTESHRRLLQGDSTEVGGAALLEELTRTDPKGLPRIFDALDAGEDVGHEPLFPGGVSRFDRLRPVGDVAVDGARSSVSDDRRRQSDPMVLRPWWSERFPGSVENLHRSMPQSRGCIGFDRLRVVGADRPATFCTNFRKHLAVHHRIGSAFVGSPPLRGDVFRKIWRPDAHRQRSDWFRDGMHEFVQRSTCHSHGRLAHARDQRRQRCIVGGTVGTVHLVGSTLMVNGCGRQPGLDQLNSPTVDHLEVRRCGDRHGPAEVMSDPDAHSWNCATRRGSAAFPNAGTGRKSALLAGARQDYGPGSDDTQITARDWRHRPSRKPWRHPRMFCRHLECRRRLAVAHLPVDRHLGAADLAHLSQCGMHPE